MTCPCCSVTCPCSDNAPLSFFVTILNMDGLNNNFAPSFAAALKADFLGQTFELTRSVINQQARQCGLFFEYESSDAACSPLPACTSSTKAIRLRAFPIIEPATNRYYLTIERAAAVPGVGSGCAFVFGRQGTSNGAFSSFAITSTEFTCVTAGSHQAQLWNNCFPGPQFFFKAADVLIEW